MSDDVIIKKHITHTNNTLIFGRLNGNAAQGIPSLASAIIGQENLGVVIESIYNGDATQQLAVKHIDDVVRIFKPAYYFSVSQESVDGIDTKVVEHSLKYRPNSLPVEITSESLCFKLLTTNGRLSLNDMIAELRSSFQNGRTEYLAAAKSRNPARKAREKQIRSNLVSRLTEPVTAYLILAESTRCYNVLEPDASEDPESNAPITRINILVPVFENGDWRLEEQPLKVETPADIPLDMDEGVEPENVTSRTALENEATHLRRDKLMESMG